MSFFFSIFARFLNDTNENTAGYRACDGGYTAVECRGDLSERPFVSLAAYRAEQAYEAG